MLCKTYIKQEVIIWGEDEDVIQIHKNELIENVTHHIVN